MTTRRTFLKSSGAAVGAFAALRHVPGWPNGIIPTSVGPPLLEVPTDEDIRALMAHALNVAAAAGAAYADVRIGRYQNQFIVTREQQIVQVIDTDSIGAGIRTLVDGTWGFAATRILKKDSIAAAVQQAVAIAKANRIAQDSPVMLAPAPVVHASWRGAFRIDPWDIPVEEKAELLLRANAEALRAKHVRFVSSTMYFVKETRHFASSEGSVISPQITVRSWVPMSITAVTPDESDFQKRSNTVPPAGRGYEYIQAADLVGHSRQWGEEASQKLSATPVQVGRYDLVLHPTNLWLTMHESIAHPTELDRILGYEANLAGTSFVAPPKKMLGQFRYGPEFMNIQGDRSQPGACATIGYDDEGVQPEDYLIIKQGIVNDFQTTREQASWLKWWYDTKGRPVRSHGNSNADSWEHVQFQRMPNVSLLPGDKDLSWNDVIGATDKGIAIIGDGSFSIDHQRYNAQFGGQLFYEIKGGKLGRMLKDVAYQIRTPEFWNSMDMIGGKSSYMLCGTFFDGKGQPEQVNAVGHGCVPSRFRGVTVINTGRKV
jgi:TldD protein